MEPQTKLWVDEQQSHVESVLGWNEMHGGSMDRHSSSEIGQRGEADRDSRVLQLAHGLIILGQAATLKI